MHLATYALTSFHTHKKKKPGYEATYVPDTCDGCGHDVLSCKAIAQSYIWYLLEILQLFLCLLTGSQSVCGLHGVCIVNNFYHKHECHLNVWDDIFAMYLNIVLILT